MSNQPPYNNPPPQGNYPPGNYPPPPPGYQGGGYPPPGPPPGKTQTLGLDYNVAALLCYIPICPINVIFAIIWLATEPKHNRFLRFHALQSIFLSVGGVILYFVLSIVGGMAVAASPFSSASWSLFSLLQGAVWVGLLVLTIIGMIKAYGNQMWKIPVIGDIAEKNI